MPTYEYICKNCGHTFAELQSIREDQLLRCPQCTKDALARVMGSGGGLIFKGSGFYGTDYKKSSSPTPPADGIEEKKPETKPDATPSPSAAPPVKKE